MEQAENLEQSTQVQQQTQPITLTESRKSLASALLVKDKIQLAVQIAPFLEKGRPNYPQLFSVPRDQRLPAMMEENLAVTLTVVSTAIGLYLGSSGIGQDLAVDIAEAVLGDCAEDNLTLQDVVIFVKAAAAGKYGAFLRNVPTPQDFMKMFEMYRQERYEAILNIRDEQNTQAKAQGPTERESDDREAVKQLQKNAVMQHYLNTNK